MKVRVACQIVVLLLSTGVPELQAHAAQSGDTELARLVKCALPLEREDAQTLLLELVESVPNQPPVRRTARMDFDFAEGQRRMRVRLTAPSDVAGATYLMTQSGDAREIYVYLPVVERVQRVSPGSRVPLLGTGFDLSALFSILLGGDAVSVTGGRTLEKQGRSLRKVHVSRLGADGRVQASTLWIDVDSCQVTRVDAEDGSFLEMQFAEDEERWPVSMRIHPDGGATSSTLRIVSRETLRADVSFQPARFHR